MTVRVLPAAGAGGDMWTARLPAAPAAAAPAIEVAASSPAAGASR